jgi:hypothetical protein
MLWQSVADLAPMDQDLEKQHQEKTKVKNIQSVEMGRYEARYCPTHPRLPALHVPALHTTRLLHPVTLTSMHVSVFFLAPVQGC